MHRIICLIALVTSPVILTGCKALECGDGTIERNGKCAPADESVSDAKCGPFTVLEGDQCVPMFKPTVCDDQTTSADLDPATNVTTCIGTGGGGCDAPFACPVPTDSGKQTICGQLFDVETSAKFGQAGATGARCPAATTDGPCSLAIVAYDALQFGSNPQTATPLAVGETYIDDCGRYRLTDITVPGTTVFIGLGIDDRDPTKRGPAGTTNVVGVATGARPGTAVKDFDGFVAPFATTAKWEASGGPPVSGGIYVNIFFANKVGRALQSGVTVTRNGNQIAGDDFYFSAGETSRSTIDPNAVVTGENGTALVTNAKVSDGLVCSGEGGGISAMCKWESRAGASLPNILFIQEFRPQDVLGMTCER